MIVNGGDSSTNIYIPPAATSVNDYITYSFTTKAKWVCHGKHPCNDCFNMHGKVKTMEEWVAGGFLPGWHKHCNCSLVQVDEQVSSDHEVPQGPEYQGVVNAWGERVIIDPVFDPWDGNWHHVNGGT